MSDSESSDSEAERRPQPRNNKNKRKRKAAAKADEEDDDSSSSDDDGARAMRLAAAKRALKATDNNLYQLPKLKNELAHQLVRPVGRAGRLGFVTIDDDALATLTGSRPYVNDKFTLFF